MGHLLFRTIILANAAAFIVVHYVARHIMTKDYRGRAAADHLGDDIVRVNDRGGSCELRISSELLAEMGVGGHLAAAAGDSDLGS